MTVNDLIQELLKLPAVQRQMIVGYMDDNGDYIEVDFVNMQQALKGTALINTEGHKEIAGQYLVELS